MSTARSALERTPQSYRLLFNRRGTQVKVLYWDRSGFCLWAKRLEEGRFVANWDKVRTCEIDWTGLKLLLEGIEPGRRKKRYHASGAPIKTLQNSGLC